MSDPTRHPAWQRLNHLARDMVKRDLGELVADDARFDALCLTVDELTIDFSKQRADAAVIDTLAALADEAEVARRFAAQRRGDKVNVTEDRAVLHTALRAPPAERPVAVADEIDAVLGRVLAFAAAVRDGRITGYLGSAFTDVVHIGIGGSHLGPELCVDALRAYAASRLTVHFVANVDGHTIARVLRGLDPERTLFLIASKSFSTVETAINAESARSWFLERTGRLDAVARHFAAISSNVEAARRFGIAHDRVFPMWDWVGGRYSIWSAVGLPLALAIGPDHFRAFLDGAHAMDEHAAHAPTARNAPFLLGLLGIWNTNLLGAESHAVLAYDERLARLADYLQQLEMESNGKSVGEDGTPVGVPTTPVLWGGEETNGQHAFHQFLHQGTRAFAADLIACIRPDHARHDHHRWLLANCLAQSEAMLAGAHDSAMAHDPLAAHKRVAGNHATTTILLSRLSPRALGNLIALYEHKVMTQGIIWGINSFDQWGVELGKRLGETLHAELGGGRRHRHDASTRALVTLIGRQGTRSGS